MTLEKQAQMLWRKWGSAWAMNTACCLCGEIKFCRGKRRAGMVCLECFDLGRKK